MTDENSGAGVVRTLIPRHRYYLAGWRGLCPALRVLDARLAEGTDPDGIAAREVLLVRMLKVCPVTPSTRNAAILTALRHANTTGLRRMMQYRRTRQPRIARRFLRLLLATASGETRADVRSFAVVAARVLCELMLAHLDDTAKTRKAA